MPVSINSLTRAEIEKILLEQRRVKPLETRECSWCGKPTEMRTGQKFCCPSCRVAFALAVKKVEQAQERTKMQKEIEGLKEIIAELRARIISQ